MYQWSAGEVGETYDRRKCRIIGYDPDGQLIYQVLQDGKWATHANSPTCRLPWAPMAPVQRVRRWLRSGDDGVIVSEQRPDPPCSLYELEIDALGIVHPTALIESVA